MNHYVCLIDGARLMVNLGNPSWGGASTYVPFPVRMAGIPTVRVTKVNQSADIGIGAGDISFSGCSVNYLTDASAAANWTIFSVFAKAYPGL